MTAIADRPVPASGAPAVTPGLPHVDLLRLRDRLEPAERARLDAIEDHLQTRVRPHLTRYWDAEEFAFDLLPGLAELGLGRLVLDGSSSLFQQLVHAEIARVDLSLSALVGIHNELNLGMIASLGSERQKATWQGRLESFDALGAFCLTEPDHGSDIAGGLATTATRDGDEWVIRGAKRWIGAGTIADVALVWARDTADGEIKGFVVPTDTPGYEATKIEHKTAVKIVQNADITFTDVRIPAENKLEKANTFADTNVILLGSRNGLGWQAVGAQQGILDAARRYALERTQFGRPIAGHQLVQSLLVQIAANLAATLGMAHRAVQLEATGEVSMTQASLVKLKTSQMCRESAALGRQMMGGNGILADVGLGRFFCDVEAIFTYEGTYEVNSLIVGRGLTGHSAFL